MLCNTSASFLKHLTELSLDASTIYNNKIKIDTFKARESPVFFSMAETTKPKLPHPRDLMNS